jgi:uncharacterized protein YndB with AHSA1/START domain
VLVQTMGRLRAEQPGRRGIRFERLYDYRPEELWAALTEPEQLRGWLGQADAAPTPGGGVTLALAPGDEAQTAHLSVRRLEPGRLVEYDWRFPGEDPSVLRFELERRGNGTLLVLDHRRLAADDAPGYGAGWHSHLDALELCLVGRVHDWDDRFAELHPEYRAQAAALPSGPRAEGQLYVVGDRCAVRFTRRFPVEPPRLWAALTEPAQLAGWLAEATFEPRVGGRIALRFDDGDVQESEVLVWEPPRLLEYSWDETVVRWELEPDESGTLLILEHRPLAAGTAASYGAGWHSHLDALEQLLGGPPTSFSDRYRALLPFYEERAEEQ